MTTSEVRTEFRNRDTNQDIFMAARVTKPREAGDKPREAADPVPEAEEGISQRKRRDPGRFVLQVDRQTKATYATAELAEAAGMAIKIKYPIVQVSVYDNIECQNTLVELPASG